MKLLLLLFTLISINARADWTDDYLRQNGTQVQGYEHTHRDNQIENNYGYQNQEIKAYEREVRREYQPTNYNTRKRY